MVGKIIKFPKTVKRKQPLADVLVDRLTDTTNHVNLKIKPKFEWR